MNVDTLRLEMVLLAAFVLIVVIDVLPKHSFYEIRVGALKGRFLYIPEGRLKEQLLFLLSLALRYGSVRLFELRGSDFLRTLKFKFPCFPLFMIFHFSSRLRANC